MSSPIVSNGDMVEIDLDNKNDCKNEKKEQKLPRPKLIRSVRYYVVLFALISPFVVSYSKTIINFAIIDMIDPTMDLHSSRPQESNGTQGDVPVFDLDNSCPVNEEERKRLLEDMNKVEQRKRTSEGSKFLWDTDMQGLLKAAYSIGHAPLQISGGRLSEIYGSRWVMGFCAAAIGICCFIAPLLAKINFYLLFGDLILLGVFGSFMTPAIFTLFARWLTPGEKSQFVSFYMVASRLGFGLSSLICGQMFEMGYSWRHVYFSAGLFSGIYALAFLLLVRSRPQDHPVITELEVNYLASKNLVMQQELALQKQMEAEKCNGNPSQLNKSIGSSSKKKLNTKAPWGAILCSMPVWAFVVTKFCVKLAGDAIAIELPVYLKRVMHYPNRTNGLVNFMNYAVFCIGSATIGSLSKYLIKNRPFGMSKTAIRKSFQSVASFVVGAALFLMAIFVCNKWITESMLFLVMFFTTFGAGGEIQSPLDLSTRYSGTIHAIASTAAITGIIEPMFVGIFMKDHQADKNNWLRIWMGASAVSFLGGFVFLFFADATIQPFDSISFDEQDNRKDDNNSNNKRDKQQQMIEFRPRYKRRDPEDSVIIISTQPGARNVISGDDNCEEKQNHDQYDGNNVITTSDSNNEIRNSAYENGAFDHEIDKPQTKEAVMRV